MILNESLRILGHYELDGQFYLNKQDLFLDIKKRQSPAAPIFRFNDEIYSCYDWTKEPDPHLSLWSYYTQRAQQLRDHYDYIILQFSGGPDSTNVLEVFDRNNIYLDEIVNFNSYDKTQVHTGLNNADYIYNVRPKLDDFLLRHTNTKVTVIDEIEMTQTVWRDWNRIGGHHEHYQGSSSYSAVTWLFKALWVKHVPHVWKLITSGKRVAVIIGSDKSNIKIDTNGKPYTYIVDTNGPDTALAFGSDPDLRHYEIVEWFYHTPKMPQLWIKQAQVLKKLVDNLSADDFESAEKYRGTDYRPSFACESKRHSGNLKYNIYHKAVYPYWSASVITPKPAYNGTRIQDTWWASQLPRDQTTAWQHGFVYMLQNFKDFIQLSSDKKQVGGLPPVITQKYYLE